MNAHLRNILKRNNFASAVYRLLTIEECRQRLTELGRNPRMFRFACQGEENPGKNVYLMHFGATVSGMFYLVTETLYLLEVAERFHFTPVVEWSHDVPYSTSDDTNPFLLFYQPVSDISVESAKKSEAVAYAQSWDCAYGERPILYDFSQDKLERLAPLYGKYLKLQPELQAKINGEIKEILGAAFGKVLGIHVRGADWKKPIAGHPIIATEEEYLHAAQEMMREFRYEKVFLATDSEETVKLFRSEFGDRLITAEAMRTAAGSESLAIFDKKNDPYQMGFEVLRDAYTLAACDSLLCGLSYVSFGARMINMNTGTPYKKVVVLNKGTAKKGISPMEAWRKETEALNK